MQLKVFWVAPRIAFHVLCEECCVRVVRIALDYLRNTARREELGKFTRPNRTLDVFKQSSHRYLQQKQLRRNIYPLWSASLVQVYHGSDNPLSTITEQKE